MSTRTSRSRVPDWNCPRCHFLIFGSKGQCSKCGTPNPHRAKLPTRIESSQRAGDWSCRSCNFHNFASRSNCKNCGLKMDGLKEAPNRKSGDWDCPKCHDFIFARKKFCGTCRVDKEGNEIPPEKMVGVCVMCFDENPTIGLVHGDSVHRCCCAECADLLMSSTRKCPMCRQMIEKTIKVF